MIDCLLGDSSGFCPDGFRVLFCCVVFGFRTHLKRLERVVRGVSFLIGVMFGCNIAHGPSVAVLCMQNKVVCNPMHQHYGALPVPYVPVRVALGERVS